MMLASGRCRPEVEIRAAADGPDATSRSWAVVRLALGTRVLGGAEVALFMTDVKWAAVVDDVFYRAEYPRAFARRAFHECRRIGQTGDARYMAAAMSTGRSPPGRG